MSDIATHRCRRNCWLISAIGAALLAALLTFFAHFLTATSLLMALGFFFAFGWFMIWSFCTGAYAGQMSDTSVVGVAEQSKEPSSPGSATEIAARDPDPIAMSPALAPSNIPLQASKIVLESDVSRRSTPVDTENTLPKSNATKPKRRAPAQAEATSAKVKPSAITQEPATNPKKRRASKVGVLSGPSHASGLDAAMGRIKEVASSPELEHQTELLVRPRGGKPDDLKKIKGVGPVLEQLLNSVGIWHFDQIANWKARDIELVDTKLEGFKGRITRDAWVKQARILARGVMGGPSEADGKGGVS